MNECFLCGKARYQPASNKSDCLSCPLRKTTNMAAGDTSCVCEAKYYEDKFGNCTVCPDTLNCDKEGATIETMDIVVGAWRPNTGSDDIYTCPVKEACQGGNDTNLYCVNGTGGVLCASCIEGWFRRGNLDTCQM